MVEQNLLSGPVGQSSPSPALPPPANQNQSVEQQALQGGNHQQVSNFMNALNRTGAGSNNTFMNAPQQQASTAQPLINPAGMPLANGMNTPNQMVAQNTMSQGTIGAPTLTGGGNSLAGTNTPGYYAQQGQGSQGNQAGQGLVGGGGNTQGYVTPQGYTDGSFGIGNVPGGNFNDTMPQGGFASKLPGAIGAIHYAPFNQAATPHVIPGAIGAIHYAPFNQAAKPHVTPGATGAIPYALFNQAAKPHVTPGAIGAIPYAPFNQQAAPGSIAQAAFGTPITALPTQSPTQLNPYGYAGTPIAQSPTQAATSTSQVNPAIYAAFNAPQQSFTQLASDENLKENIKPAENDIQNFLDTIKAHNYEYKDKQDGVGTFTSPMAQELEKTELGKQAVIDTPRGKMVNYGRLSAVNLAAVSVVHREQKRLQEQMNQLRNEFKKVK